MTSRDKRRHKRFELEAFVDYTGREFLLNHRIYDLSLGGMRLATSEPEPLGTSVDLVITFPDLDAAIEVKGEVVWVKPAPDNEMGIKFNSVGMKELKLLQEYLKKIEEKR
ncbi:PilZ domain-containing protein [Myxococcota bacterium]|jgi:uncharacterized protein (TIGR02266 family)|nr:PilZ domain-containing protein [Myxococcota bacterium]PKN23754.1 MAG: hypothetical protein CVU65_13690 [Deltaproteobacteria bacterium HGW-Deltaproteobacteria-22]PKN47782.1 MAG: hypothetical protein CVU59_01530 [Deltaproteobacteria bacterium HGW-Deltaproteobacteria-17]MBU1242803.1 PilZ domain-containing protein [Myxococcota bacterium]MBU1411926.1 PilZ domain-containing protein [Myxococcota bacterium]